MKIVAYSKIPSATPFVHLGYLAASRTIIKPVQGLALSGVMILIAGLSLGGGFRCRKSAEPGQPNGQHRPRPALVRCAVLFLGTVFILCAFVFGEKQKRYVHPDRLTSLRVQFLAADIATYGEADDSRRRISARPDREGEFDLFSACLPLCSQEECRDAWNTPLMLRVTRHENRLRYTVVSAGPDRIVGTQDDITSDRQK